MISIQRVLSVGQCNPDHAMIHAAVTDHFAVELDRVMFVDEALDALSRQHYDLVLVNRLIFEDNSPGIELVRRMRADPALRGTPVMLISNYPDALAEAVVAGAVPGFGKANIGHPNTRALLSAYLQPRTAG